MSIYVRRFYLEHSFANIHYLIHPDLDENYSAGNAVTAFLTLNTFGLQLTTRSWIFMFLGTIFSKPNIQKNHDDLKTKVLFAHFGNHLVMCLQADEESESPSARP